MANCPFCTDILLRHIRAGRPYWLCRRCRTEIFEDDFNPSASLEKEGKKPVKEELFAQMKPNHSQTKVERDIIAQKIVRNS